MLKYLWPGVITQSVDAAVNGEDMVDPETGDTYKVSGFASELGELASPEVTAPMIVKPDPLIETTAIRGKLQDIANFAVQQAGKCHYRFFCYTDPTIGLSSTAPAEAKWAAGTKPTVCSSLIWMAIKDAGLTMEGALEPADLDGGAQIAVNTPDGLYVYDADERLAAGEVLFNRLHNFIMITVGSFGDALTDVADDISNQVLNTFATDWADEDAKDSEQWRETVDANAVSPQNLMFYDGPHYGFSEPLIFRDWRVEEVVVHKWKKVAQTGTIKGVVRFKGDPVQGANVQLSVSQFTASQSDGSFEIKGAPAGPVLLDVQKVQDNMLLTALVHRQRQGKPDGHGERGSRGALAPVPPHPGRRIHGDDRLRVRRRRISALRERHRRHHRPGSRDRDAQDQDVRMRLRRRGGKTVRHVRPAERRLGEGVGQAALLQLRRGVRR